VVICTRGRAHELGDCLQAVARLRYPRFEVLVGENGPPDGRTQAVAEWYGGRYLAVL
jgi:glycosyltransferase involved in cell wall biosynthesis